MCRKFFVITNTAGLFYAGMGKWVESLDQCLQYEKQQNAEFVQTFCVPPPSTVTVIIVHTGTCDHEM